MARSRCSRRPNRECFLELSVYILLDQFDAHHLLGSIVACETTLTLSDFAHISIRYSGRLVLG